MSLLLKLQRRVAELEKEKMDLQGEMDTKEEQQQLEQTKVRTKTVRFKSTKNEILLSCTGSHACSFCVFRNWKIVGKC